MENKHADANLTRTASPQYGLVVLFALIDKQKDHSS